MPATTAPVSCGPVRVSDRMKLMRSAAAVGIARRIYAEARKPENQRKIKKAVANLQERRAKSGKGRSGR